MKKILIALLLALSLFGCSVNMKINSTNLDGVCIFSQSNNAFTPHIVFNDGSKEEISENYIPLFVNGSLLKCGGILTESNDILVPINEVCNAISIDISLSSESGKAFIKDGSNNIELYENNKNAKINKENYSLEIEPKVIDNSLFIGLNDIAEILNTNVLYFDNSNKEDVHIINNVSHIMISKYPENAHGLSEAEAMRILKEKLLTAYEKKFGKFNLLNEKPSVQDDEKMLRYLITNMKIEAENDRFYIVPVMHEFWIDKYTKEIYIYYSGVPMTINLFDEEAKNAIDFPG
ncbi:MAG: stalk domain-containing protein [Oscillospiraceae bacterium]